MKISSSDIRRAGDAYFMALDGLGCPTDIVITCDLKESLAFSSALSAYRKLIETHALLQRVKHRDPAAGTWEWKSVPESVWRAHMESWYSRLEKEGESVENGATPCALPLRLSACKNRRLEFRIDHTFANGKAGYWWVDRYFQVLCASEANPADGLCFPDEEADTHTAASIWQAYRYVAGVTWTRYTMRSWGKDIRGAFLKDARTPAFSFRTSRMVLPRHHVVEMISREKKAGESFTQTLSRKLVEHVFESRPDLRAMGIQIAADLHASCGVALSSIGNFTGLTTGYIERRKPLEAQVGALFAQIRSEGALGFIKAFSMLLGSQAKKVGWFKTKFKLVTQKAGDLMLDHLCMVSNLGVVEGEHLGRRVAAISLRTFTPHIYISLSCINDSATFELVCPDNIYDERIVTDVVGGFIGKFVPPAEVRYA